MEDKLTQKLWETLSECGPTFSNLDEAAVQARKDYKQYGQNVYPKSSDGGQIMTIWEVFVVDAMRHIVLHRATTVCETQEQAMMDMELPEKTRKIIKRGDAKVVCFPYGQYQGIQPVKVTHIEEE